MKDAINSAYYFALAGISSMHEIPLAINELEVFSIIANDEGTISKFDGVFKKDGLYKNEGDI